MNEEYHQAKAEGVHVKIIRKDSSGNQVSLGTDENGEPIMEKTGITQADGTVLFTDLEGSGDFSYEITQEEPRPAAFYLGDMQNN